MSRQDAVLILTGNDGSSIKCAASRWGVHTRKTPEPTVDYERGMEEAKTQEWLAAPLRPDRQEP